MKPALTAEEWGNVDLPVADTPESRHATAALCLHGQPFGFTREDVIMLRAARLRLDGEEQEDAWDKSLDSLADRIEALLPPENDALTVEEWAKQTSQVLAGLSHALLPPEEG